MYRSRREASLLSVCRSITNEAVAEERSISPVMSPVRITALFGRGSDESFSLTVNVASDPLPTVNMPSAESGTAVSVVASMEDSGVSRSMILVGACGGSDPPELLPGSAVPLPGSLEQAEITAVASISIPAITDGFEMFFIFWS